MKILNYERCMAGGLCRYDERKEKYFYTGVSLISSMEFDDLTILSPWSDCSCSSPDPYPDSVILALEHKKEVEKRERARDRKRRIVEAHMEEEYRLKSLT
eukprot:scaffold7570_cov69-Cyclotella_meneghiniana.AAC.1